MLVYFCDDFSVSNPLVVVGLLKGNEPTYFCPKFLWNLLVPIVLTYFFKCSQAARGLIGYNLRFFKGKMGFRFRLPGRIKKNHGTVGNFTVGTVISFSFDFFFREPFCFFPDVGYFFLGGLIDFSVGSF